MSEFLSNSAYFGVLVSLVSYWLGAILKKKFKSPLINPLLISIVLTIPALLLLHIDYSTYYEGAKYLAGLLTPATVALAVPLYEQFELLKHNAAAVIVGILAGVLSSLGSVLGLAALFGFSHEEYITFLPEVDNHRDRHGSFRGAGRDCIHHGRSNNHHRRARKYSCRSSAESVQDNRTGSQGHSARNLGARDRHGKSDGASARRRRKEQSFNCSLRYNYGCRSGAFRKSSIN